MNSFMDLASTRRSIRKYTDREIPDEDIEYFIRAATAAPSGCNSQCWRFIAIKDKVIKEQAAKLVTSKMEELLSSLGTTLTEEYLNSKRKMMTFFVNAPVVIAVFMTHLEYYDPTLTAALEKRGYDYESRMKLFAYADVLSIGAAVQNLLLAVHEKGYGACWMNDPAVAGKEINKLLKVPEENMFMSFIPVGYPAYNPRGKQMKDFGEIFSVI